MKKIPLKMRTSGSTPVMKWINLVNKWNSCVDFPDSPYSRQRMIFVKAEAADLLIQYPALKIAIQMHDELDTHQIEALRYGDYKFEFDLPNNCPKACVIGGFTLLD